MKTLILKVQDEKYEFLIELLNHFNFVKIEKEINEEEILNQRLQELKSNEIEAIDFEKVKEILK